MYSMYICTVSPAIAHSFQTPLIGTLALSSEAHALMDVCAAERALVQGRLAHRARAQVPAGQEYDVTLKQWEDSVNSRTRILI